MKIIALLCGLLASAFAWGAGIYLEDVGVQFLDLWPETISQQFLGLVLWHVIIALALVGGALTVVSPVSGALLLLAVAGGWAWLAYSLPVGFSPQTIVPMALAGLGVLAAIGAMFRGRARRRFEQHQLSREEREREEREREEALRLDPSEEPASAFEDQLSLEPEPAVARVVPAREPRRSPDEAPPHGVSGAMAANIAVLLLLAGGLGIVAYSEFRSGDLSAAFAPSGPRAAHVAEGVPSVPAAALPDAAGASEASATDNATGEPPPDPATADGPSTATDAEQRTEIAALPADSAAAPRTEAGEEFADPFSYCTSVETIDFPDYRYVGPPVVAAIADILQVPVESSPDRVKWRCYEGAVLACAAFDGPVCAVTPSVSEMVAFCARNPGASGLEAPNGSWSCAGDRPEIPPGQSWPVDARGFLPAAWQVVPVP